jgi:hypothetical protein
MGFYSNYVSRNGSTDLARTVNAEWVLKKLDELKDSVYIPTYNAFVSFETLSIGTRGDLSKGSNASPDAFTWTTNASGKYEIVSLFATTLIGSLFVYSYLAKSVY